MSWVEALHARGADWRQRRGPGRLSGLAWWAAWMTALFWSHPSAEGNRLRAVGRLWTWQVRRRVAASPVLVDLGDIRIRCPTWSSQGGSLVSVGFVEWWEAAFIEAFLRPGDRFLDVGANLGLYAVLAARLGAHVHAFEPSVRACEALRANLALNGIAANCSIHPVALADYRGRAGFTAELDVEAHLVAERPGSSTVAVDRLDEIVDRAGLDDIALLKVDAEGADGQVLRGARSVLDEQRPVVLVEVWEGRSSILELLRDLGYICTRYDPGTRTLEELPGAFRGGGNVLAVPARDHSTVTDRLAEGAAARVRRPRVHWLAPDPTKGGEPA